MIQDLKKLTITDIEKAIKSYLKASESREKERRWFKKYETRPAITHFLLWQGKELPAKAIVKCALREKGLDIRFLPREAIRPLKKFKIVIKVIPRAEKRRREWFQRLARDGQAEFRLDAMEIWDGCCAISGCDVDTALEAAHIIPHAKEGKMDAKNSILLRVDLHRLFDMNLMAINPNTMRVSLKKKAESHYRDLKGKKVKLPKDGGPSAKDFKKRWKQFRAK